MSADKPEQFDKAEAEAAPAEPEAAETDPAAEPDGAESTGKDISTQLAERIADLQRVTAEYHNYRKRVERDKAMLSEQVTANVVTSLLPILDDIDRAREHGDLEGPFASVSEQLQNTLSKLGLEVFGEKGDAFDPMIHEAVAHMHSGEVTEPSCIDVMRRGYRIGDRLLRAAMVAVAEPEGETAAGADPGTEPEPAGAVEPVADSDEEKADEEGSEESSSSSSSSGSESPQEEPETAAGSAEQRTSDSVDNGDSKS